MTKKADKAKAALLGLNEATAIHWISQDFAMACLLETLAKRQPTIAEAVAQAMSEGVQRLPVNKYPGLHGKIDKYIWMIRGHLATKPR
jgi:hypothetical protein